jgi:protein tyrosine phosphatase (PTP) superfamily phosphohydrolase (DUF442 family)
MTSKMFGATLLLLSGLTSIAHAASAGPAESASAIVNYREYTTSFASSGQLAGHHLEPLKKQGFQRIVYLAYRAHGNAPDTLSIDQQATDLGLSYVHIPVPWQSPSQSDYQTFAAVMRAQPAMKTLLHCQMNYRASAFSFLYRVLALGTPTQEALRDLNQIWSPDKTWMTFINTVLAAHDRPMVDIQQQS